MSVGGAGAGGSGGPQVHPTAAAFGRAAEAYERARPGYPPAVLELLRTRLRLGPGRRVLDLGAGTGKLTRELAATGAEVVAVEPVPEMADELRRAVPDVAVLPGTAESIPLPAHDVDAATVAQALHWFDIPVALRELHRVLRPDGVLAIVFNRRALDTPVQRSVDDLLLPVRGDTPSWGDHSWEQQLLSPTGFRHDGTSRHRHEQAVPVEHAVERVASISFVAALDDGRRAALLREARARLRTLTGPDDRLTLVHDAEVTFLVRAADHPPAGRSAS